MCIQSTTVSQCPAEVFSERDILNAPILNFWSQHLNAFVYTDLNAQKIYVDGYGWDGMGMGISVSTSSKSTALRC